MNEQNKISWMALRYSEKEDNIKLQIGLALILGIIVAGALAYKNYIFGGFIFIASILIYKIKKKEEPYIPIDVHQKGISINNIITEFERISVFYIDQHEDESYLVFKLKNTFMNANKIIIIEPEVDISELRKFLLNYLPENRIKQTAVDKIINSF